VHQPLASVLFQDQAVAAVGFAPDAGELALLAAEAQQADLRVLGVHLGEHVVQVGVDRLQAPRCIQALAADGVADAALDLERHLQVFGQPAARRGGDGREQAFALLVDEPLHLAVLHERLQHHGGGEQQREGDGNGCAQRELGRTHPGGLFT
jgi:hypothetical protein